MRWPDLKGHPFELIISKLILLQLIHGLIQTTEIWGRKIDLQCTVNVISQS
jgi:hypothetical protein